MKKILMAAILSSSVAAYGQSTSTAVIPSNPFLSEFTTPYGVPPFEKITIKDYREAFLKGMEQQKQEINAIVAQRSVPDFQNTIEALDRSGKILNTVSSVFYAQNDCNTSPEMQNLDTEISPLLSSHEDDILMNAALFAKIKEVYNNRSKFNLDKEQNKLLDETYKKFVRNGANLDEAGQKKLRELNSKITLLQLTFAQNMLKETNAFKLVIDNKKDLSGLPQSLVTSAAETAKDMGINDKWVFTLHNPSIMPFLQYADNRALREKIFKAYINRCNNGNKEDNKALVRNLLSARLEKAKLLGFKDYASFALDDRMAKTEENVYKLLDQLWTPAVNKAKEELADIQKEIKKEGKNFQAEGWDWHYYFEKAKIAKYNLDENEIRPYLELNHVRDGVFYVAKRLYGITFRKLDYMPMPYPDAEAFECTDKDGSSLGVIYFDYFPRPSKAGGAWCGTYRPVYYENGHKVNANVYIVCNLTKPAAGEPALLSVDEAQTLFHEFGHALHDFFKDVHYNGTSEVPTDFVELPSQIDEHWAFEPEVLKVYAKHYQTGEVMPASLVEKIINSGKYGQGFATTEYLAASLLDMDFHTLKSIPANLNVMDFEAKTLGKRGLLKQIPSRYRTTYFNHVMGGGYTAGYYSYIWAEVLDCDAFEAYKEKGDIFDQDIAGKFRKCILSRGGIDDAMEMYKNFRGREPEIKGLLKSRGLEISASSSKSKSKK